MQLKRRDGLLSAIFGVLTCGLYNIYFWYRYGEDVNVICADDGKETMNYIVAWLLSLVTCGIYGMYWRYMLASRLDTASKKYDVNVESPVFFTLFMNIPFLSYFYSCDVMNKFQEKYERMHPNSNGGYGMNGYGANGYGGNNVPPVSPNGSGNGQSLGAQIGSQFKSAVQDMGNGIKNSAQNVMPTCKNCGAIVPPGKNYCKNCGYPVNGPAPQNGSQPTPPKGTSGSAAAPMGTSVPKSAPAMANETKTQSAPQEKTAADSVPKMESEKKAEPQTPVIKEQPSVNPVPPVGTPAPRMCPKCGSAVKPGDRFCIHCGSKIE